MSYAPYDELSDEDLAMARRYQTEQDRAINLARLQAQFRRLGVAKTLRALRVRR